MFSLFETFIAVYETKSFTRAGNYSFISQPTVTVRIKKLEEELQTSLFSRGQHQEIIPTRAADLLYGKALQYLNDWEKIQKELKQQNQDKHSFKLGLSQSAATSIVPTLFKTFIDDLEQLNVEIVMYDSEKIFDLVKNHDLHFGIIEKPIMSDRTETFQLFQDELVLAGNLESDIFFVREKGSGVGHYTQMYLREQEYAPKNIVQINSNGVIIALLKAGIGASLISKRFVSEGIFYKSLGKRYFRNFSGVSFLDERDIFIQKLIMQIKSVSENIM